MNKIFVCIYCSRRVVDIARHLSISHSQVTKPSFIKRLKYAFLYVLQKNDN